LLWITLYSFGLLNEGRVVAVRLEAIRLLVVVPVMLAVITTTGAIGVPLEIVAVYTAFYVFASLTGLWLAGRNRHMASQAIQTIGA
jgi:hypothetical protein